MKKCFILSLILGGALLTGCASFKNGLVLGTVGPGPEQKDLPISGSGTLTVYSAYEVNADFNMRDPYRREYSDYRILNRDGKLLERIHNVTDDILQNPVPVELSAGRYFVTANSNGYGTLTIPVVIAANQDTVLHLEGGNTWPDESLFNVTNAVCFPDGEIVGWKNMTAF